MVRCEALLEGLFWSLLGLTLFVRLTGKGRFLSHPASSISSLHSAKKYIGSAMWRCCCREGDFGCALRVRLPMGSAHTLLPWRFWMLGERRLSRHATLKHRVPDAIFSNIVRFLSTFTQTWVFLYLLLSQRSHRTEGRKAFSHHARISRPPGAYHPHTPGELPGDLQQQIFFSYVVIRDMPRLSARRISDSHKGSAPEGGALFLCLILGFVFVKEDILMTRSVVRERAETRERQRDHFCRSLYKVHCLSGSMNPSGKSTPNSSADIKTQLSYRESAEILRS